METENSESEEQDGDRGQKRGRESGSKSEEEINNAPPKNRTKQ